MPIILALMATLLMSALGAALVLTTSSDALIAANFRNAQEGVYAADAALERAIADLGPLADWNAVLDGSASSTFVDGSPGGVRTLADGSALDLGQTLNVLNCRKITACSASDLTANTAQRPWGANNPVWRLFACGPLSSLLSPHAIESAYYVIVMIADDPSENDDDPLRDGQGPTNPGTGVLSLRAEAFGPRGARQAIEVTATRPGMEGSGVRVLSWRLRR
jgi:type IV pilus assembly PilX-like protein